MNPERALWRDPPPPVRGNERDTWAQHSIVARLPDIGKRTLKSELAAGLTEADIRRAARQDPDWMTNGRWGLIQFAPPAA